MHGSKISSYLSFLLTLFCLGIFVFISTFNIQTPGLYYDEALFVNAASGGVTDLFVYKRFAGIPTMLMPYIGALKSWLYFPIFTLFGIDIVTIRLPAILLGALALGLTWRYVHQQFGILPATLFVMMASVEPSVIFHSRLDWGPTALMMVLRGGLLLSLTTWIQSGDKRFLILSLICAALGVFDKLNFIWIVTAVFASALLVYPERFFPGTTSQRRRIVLWFSFGSVIFFFLAAYFNPLSINLFKEIGFLDFGNRTSSFLSLLKDTIQGVGVYKFVIKGEHPSFSQHALILGLITFVGLCGLVIGLRSGKLNIRSLMFLALVIFFICFQLFFTKRATGPHHFATLAPLWLIFIAVGLSGAIEALQERFKTLILPAVFLLMASLIITSIRLDIAYLSGFNNQIISRHWDPAASVLLTSALEDQQDIKVVVAVDWGLATNVQALSDNRLKVIDLWSLFNDQLTNDQLSWIRTEFIDKGAVFVLHAKDRETFPNTRLRFLEALKNNDWPLRHTLTIHTADGQPYVEVYRPFAIQ
jgi:hypothetical protein